MRSRYARVPSTIAALNDKIPLEDSTMGRKAAFAYISCSSVRLSTSGAPRRRRG